MPLTTYEEARPWAKAIKEEVLTRRMPKWHVVRGYGDFLNDPSLSASEVALVASWADGGAPASAKAPAGKPGFAEAPAAGANRARADSVRRDFVVPDTREVTVPCTTRTWPAGRLVAVKPVLGNGGSLRVTLTHRDGSEEPLIWLKDFDRAFAETYWLRRPATIIRGMQMHASSDASCSLVLSYATPARR